MVRKWFLVGMVFLLLPWFLVGCGISQEVYDAVSSELSKAQQNLLSVEAELEAAKTKNSELTSSLGKNQDELEAAKTKNSELTSSLGKNQAELETAKTKNSELTSSLEETQTELKAIKSENFDLELANTELKSLAFINTALCSKEPSAWNPIQQPDNTFKTNQKVWVYVDYFGFKFNYVSQEFRLNILTTIKILDEEGKVVDSASWTWRPIEEEPFSWAYSGDPFGPLEAGNYTAEVEIEDNHSGEIINWEEEFKVVSR